ncbi:MAG: hypothetical protein ACE147_18810 [Candidatus Methylomirabilales bacterium]
MFDNKSRVLLILPQEVLDRARGLAGKATATLKLPVSLQIALRVLIEEGLRREGDRRVLSNIHAQAQAVRDIRSRARRGSHAAASRRPAASEQRGASSKPGPPRRSD